jgi:histidine triad (HIT) family protein
MNGQRLLIWNVENPSVKPETLSDCFVCRKQRGEVEVPGGIIYSDDLVSISHAQLKEGEEKHYLGHLFVETRRHVVDLAGLTDVEAQTLGLFTSRAARALMLAMGVEHVYSFYIGDGVPHVHIHVIGRYPGTPRKYWGPHVDEWPEAPKGDAQQIAKAVEQIRVCLQKEMGNPPPFE